MGDEQDTGVGWGGEVDGGRPPVPELPGIRGLVLRPPPEPNFDIRPLPPPLRLVPYPSTMPRYSFGHSIPTQQRPCHQSSFHLRPLCGGTRSGTTNPSESLPAFADVEAGLRRSGTHHTNMPTSTVRAPVPAVEPRSMVEYGSGFLRKSCDSCVSSKRRCDGQTPCTRCLRRKKTCHYTERKKCGPRSGAKNPKVPVRRGVSSGGAQTGPSAAAPAAPVASPSVRPPLKRSPGSLTLLASSPHGVSSPSQQPHHHHQQLQDQQHPGAQRQPSSSSLKSSGVSCSDSGSELSGDTTGPDSSDAPSVRYLERDASGSSWYTLDDNQQLQLQFRRSQYEWSCA
ncbi:unnamed protein product [Discosporangium mesarthrocarpum]